MTAQIDADRTMLDYFVARSTSTRQPSPFQSLHDRRLRIRGIRSQHPKVEAREEACRWGSTESCASSPRTRQRPY